MELGSLSRLEARIVRIGLFILFVVEFCGFVAWQISHFLGPLLT